MPVLIHSSSCLNSAIYSLLHTFSQELSLSPPVYIMTMITPQIYLKKPHIFYDILCHLFAGFSPLLPPSFYSVMTQLLRAPWRDAENYFQELSLVRAFCKELDLALYIFDPSMSQWEQRAKWSMFLCCSWAKKVIENLFVQVQEEFLCGRENTWLSCHAL